MATLDDLQDRVNKLQDLVENLDRLMRSHDHDGAETVNIRQSDVIPTVRASGSITMSTAHQTYSLGLIDNPTQVTLYGNAVHYAGGVYGTGTIDIRAFITGTALLGKSFYFQPQSSTSVVEGGAPQDIVQSSTYFGYSAADGAHTTNDEGHLVDVEFPMSGTIVVRATVTKFDNDHIEVYTDNLSAGWGIAANFVIT